MPAPSFMDLLRVHDDLDESFLRHQEALMDRRPLEALGWLRRVHGAIEQHVRDEEDILLPVYRERAGRVEGGSPELFVAEHRKIRAYLHEFTAAVSTMIETPPTRRDVLRLLDRQSLYKHLMEHHDQRERRFLYPILDRVTSAEERAATIEHLERPR
jgi:hemerythrin-like domain-containing protein